MILELPNHDNDTLYDSYGKYQLQDLDESPLSIQKYNIVWNIDLQCVDSGCFDQFHESTAVKNIPFSATTLVMMVVDTNTLLILSVAIFLNIRKQKKDSRVPLQDDPKMQHLAPGTVG
jgi:hypothetical protein